ncbi:MAG: hypothetical protein ACI3XR_02625 [Eubacteriales bacterium]
MKQTSKFTKTIAIALLCSLCICSVSMTAVSATENGGVGSTELTTFDAPAEGATAISSAEDFANIINGLDGSYYLTTDLTLTQGLSQQNESAVFTGVFDGQGHTITLNCTDTDWRNGIFCTAGGEGCTIKNLTVDGTVTSKNNSCGGVVGTAKGPILFENITSNITITATGDSDGSCGNGGILGVNEGCAVTFRNCTSNASVTGVLSAGGFIGMVRNGGASQTFENCVFNGTVRCTTPWSDKRAAGGFIGIMHKSTNDEVAVSFKDCASDGTVISDYVLASAWVGSYARYGHPDQVPTYENCTQTAKVFHNGLEISKVSDTRLMEGMDSQTSGRVTFDAEAGTVTVDSNMAMKAETLAAKVAAGVKVYVGGVLDESAEVTSSERVLKVVSHDPTVKEGEIITVVVVFSDGAVTTMSQSADDTGITRVTFTHDGANATSTDPTVNMNAEVTTPDPDPTTPDPDPSTPDPDPTTPDPAPSTGSAAVALGLMAVVSLAGAVAISKKRK